VSNELPVIAVVGRPNVGKSTLVNRIIGRREAIVQEQPGVTRDRVLYSSEWRGRPFLLVDTGGLEAAPEGPLAGKVAEAAHAAAAEADVIAFVIDVSTGATAEDLAVADVIRKIGSRVVLVANKSDTGKRERDAVELFSVGVGEPVAVSALHGRGVGDLLDVLTEGFLEGTERSSTEPAVAIVGRPNVGKSTLFNRLVGSERSIVHPEPGTTRDPIDTIVEAEGERYRFVDTAGLRRAARVDEPTEFYGTVRTRRALQRSDVAVLVVDAEEGVTRQDLRIAEEIAELGRSAVVALNKVDLLAGDEREERRAELRRRLPHVSWAPFLQLSALTGKGVDAILPTLRPILDARELRVPTPLLNAVVEDLQARTPIPSTGRGARVKYAVQAEVSPPTIVLFGASRIPEPWLRYLERGIRRRFGFEGTPIRFVNRGRPQRRRAG
jgi:GTP-binding protein